MKPKKNNPDILLPTMIVILIAMLFSACRCFHHGNFAKQKYLDLKTNKVSGTCGSEETREKPATSDVELKEEKIIKDPASNCQEEIIPCEEVILVSDTEILLPEKSPQQAHQKNAPKTQRIVKVLPAENSEPNEPIELDYLFKCGFMMIILAFLLTGMAFTAATFYMFMIYLIMAGCLFIAAWILSIIFVKRARLIPKDDRTPEFKLRKFLAELVNFIGWLVLVGNIALWFIILMLTL